ncbi:MAG: 8-amino-7-oxononanoate synthase [Bacteroidota bacterium]
MNAVDKYLAGRIAEREQAGNLRALSAQRSPVDFYSNDYLGLSTTGLLASLTPVGNHSTGSTGSRLLSGNSPQALALEHTLAIFHKAEAALLFNSGYDANIGLLSSIISRDTIVLSDELCHASIIDGIRLSLTTHKYKFRHNDLNDLETKLKRHATTGKPVIVVAESVYSMDGDKAPLTDMAALCGQHHAALVIDEAHATGVFGINGEGLVCALGLEDKIFARIHTFGKALGCHGAAVVGSAMLQQYLINYARSFIYTTALPPHSLQAIHSAYQHLQSHTFTNQPLHDLIAYFKAQVAGIPCWKQSSTPIQAYVAGNNEKAKQLATRLQQSGLQVSPILHPTVPAGQERLRVCLHTFNTREQVDVLIATTAN